MDVNMSELLLAEVEAAELPPIPEAIRHLIRPEMVAMSRKQAKAQGKRFYIGKPDKFGCPCRYTSNGGGVLSLNQEKERERARESLRRRYSTVEGYICQSIANARAKADASGVERRSYTEELYLAQALKVAHSLKMTLGGRAPVVHHARREIDEGGGHVPGNLCIMTPGLHSSWHSSSDVAGVHVSRCLIQGLMTGTIVPCPTLAGVFIERELLDRLALVAIQEAPDLLLSPMIAEAAARLRPEPANQNEKPAAVPAAA